MSELYDLIIVGAGPAGAMAAKVAGENGLKAALIERKKDTRVINRICTMIMNIDERNYDEYIHYNSRSRKFVFPHNGFTINYDGAIRKVYGFHIITPGGRRVELGNVPKGKAEDKAVGYMIDKGYMCQIMIDEARENGVDIFNNTNINNVRPESECVVLTDNRGSEYRAKFVIAADGVNSRIGRCLGFNKGRTFLGTYKDMARTYVGAKIPDEECLMFGLGWNCSISLAPEITEGHYHVAAASYNISDDLNAVIDKFLSSEPYASWFKDAKELDHKACCVSHIAVPIRVPFKDNVLLVGDSAWMQETSIPGAIMPGWRAAHSVTEALIDGKINKEGVATYLKWWDKYFFQPVGKRMASSGSADMKDYLLPEDIDYLAGLVTEPLQATMNFFTIMSTIGRAFGALLEKIQEERPDIMQKLMAMRSHPRQLVLAKRRNNGCAITL